MITSLLLFSILDFSTYVTGALVFFATALLFLDSWNINRDKKTPLIRSIGFFLLSFVYVFYASSLTDPTFSMVANVIKSLSLLLILYSLLREPVLKKPAVKRSSAIFLIPIGSLPFSSLLTPLNAILLFLIFITYLRKATKGLEKQLFGAAIAFFSLSLAELIKILFLGSNTTNVFWSQALATHGSLWNIHMLFQLIGIIVLGFWVWGYIRFRLRIQLFSIILASFFSIFLATTFIFTFLLLRNLERDTLNHLETDAQVFQYALDRLQLESLSHARSLAERKTMQDAIVNDDKKTLHDASSSFLITQNLSTVTIASLSGEVLVRGEDRETFGDNISTDPLVKSAIEGQELSTILADASHINPNVYIKSAVPVFDANKRQIGVIITGFVIDNAFVDGIKAVTGLDATIFAGNIRTATTLVAPDGKSRNIGTLQTDQNVTDTVLKNNENFIGRVNIANQPYYIAYTPLRKYGGEVDGMLSIGEPQIELLGIAQQSISLTFLGSAILLALSTIPAYFISKFLEENLQA